MVDRISTAAFHQQTLRDSGNITATLAELNRQISSGKKANSFVDLNGVVERVSGFNTKLSRVENYLTTNNAVVNRLSIMDQSVTQMQQIAQDFLSNITARISINGPEMNLQAIAAAALNNIEDQMNVSVEGRYLFSGSKTSTPPITDLTSIAITTPGVAEDNYYNGNSVKISARVSDAFEMQYGVTGDNIAFQNLISGIKTAISGDAANNTQTLQQAFQMVTDAVDGLATVRAEVNSNMASLNSVNEQHQNLRLYWKEAISIETDTDIAEASILVAANQTLLQASFQTFASLSRLRLTDYLN